MTFATIIRSVFGPSSARYYEYPATGQSQKFLSDKNGGSDYYYYYGSPKKSKGKFKSEKKHAILSALTLLAFLFFLNILQSCIREQNQIRGATMMFAPTAPTAQQSKEPGATEKSWVTEKNHRKIKFARNSTTEKQLDAVGNKKLEKEIIPVRKSRSLFGIPPIQETKKNTNRQLKFIRNYQSIKNWTKELSQVSETDFEDQKLKILNIPLYWNNNRLKSHDTDLASKKINNVTEFPTLSNKTVAPLVKRIKKRERTTVSTDLANNRNQTIEVPTWKINPQKVIRTPQNSIYKNMQQVQNTHSSLDFIGSQSSQSDWTSLSKVQVESQNNMRATEETANELQYPKSTSLTATIFSVVGRVTTTPRNKRSESSSTPRSVDYDKYERLGDYTRNDYQVPATPAVGLDLNTYQTYPVYNYYNPYYYRENETINSILSDSSVKTEVMEIDRTQNEMTRITTEPSLFYATQMYPSYYKYPYNEKTKYRKRRPDYRHYYRFNHYYPESRYRQSPYRKNGAYEPTHFHDPLHDDYHVVVARYPQVEGFGFDFIKFFWTIFTSLAKPLAKLVPTLAKENNEEAQCYDLLVCEAQRVTKFMGPAVETLTTTLGTILTWAAPEETRQVVVDALNSGKDNTCQQQIRDCESRSGGKSAMTVIAQVLEMKLP